MVNETMIVKTCEVIMQNPDNLLLDSMIAVLKSQYLAMIISFIVIPIMIFAVTSMIINPGRGKIKFGTVVWSYLLSGFICLILSIVSYLAIINI